jgi:hypothetical protein
LAASFISIVASKRRQVYYFGGGNIIPIPPFLAGRAFEPETIIQMAPALERTCAAMGLRDTDDQGTQLVARKIVQLVERGVVGADEFTSQAILELSERE